MEKKERKESRIPAKAAPEGGQPRVLDDEELDRVSGGKNTASKQSCPHCGGPLDKIKTGIYQCITCARFVYPDGCPDCGGPLEDLKNCYQCVRCAKILTR